MQDRGTLLIFLFGSFFGLAAGKTLGVPEMDWLNRSQRNTVPRWTHRTGRKMGNPEAKGLDALRGFWHLRYIVLVDFGMQYWFL